MRRIRTFWSECPSIINKEIVGLVELIGASSAKERKTPLRLNEFNLNKGKNKIKKETVTRFVCFYLIFREHEEYD